MNFFERMVVGFFNAITLGRFSFMATFVPCKETYKVIREHQIEKGNGK